MPGGPQTRVAVIGLDCAEPSLVFDRFADRLPNLTRLRRRGVWGTLRSCDPPITVPAWMSMMSSKDPGTLGYYGFRNRADRSYEKMTTATSLVVQEPLLWDFLGQAGKRVILIGVPQTYPPRSVNGLMVTDFLTPSIASNYTYPPALRDEIATLPDVHPYEFDVSDFRTPDKTKIRDALFRMTDKRFALARHLVTTKPWDYFMMVEMGTDRVHHAFWQFMDPQHHRYEPGNPFETVILNYYEHVDAHIGRLLEALPTDAHVFVVSDHGAQCMEGGIALNEWLVQNGYLVLQEPVSTPTRLEAVKVNWAKTTAWGAGGYYGRLFLNVKGREPQGVIDPNQYEATRDRLAGQLEALGDPDGKPIGTRAHKPEDLYRTVRGPAPPDLFVYFGNLRWRSVGTVGGPIHTFENDTGPDDANHAPEGMLIAAGPGIPARGPVSGMQLMDVTPSILRLFGLEVPAELQGSVIDPLCARERALS
ncbi:MAG TPA: alkaline phosphatase family protein [Isosphaeraceae bacterium]|jgi:predicted AlkP superfamily phosphohydrolase/phosphomutase|nr:alkaline phosphatase family protein [Isosphaeraceae bacterium]